MNIIIALATGTLIGWWLSTKSGIDGREELIINVLIGSVGAYVGGWILTAVIDTADPSSLSLGLVVAAILGAAAALILVNKIRNA